MNKALFSICKNELDDFIIIISHVFTVMVIKWWDTIFNLVGLIPQRLGYVSIRSNQNEALSSA